MIILDTWIDLTNLVKIIKSIKIFYILTLIIILKLNEIINNVIIKIISKLWETKNTCLFIFRYFISKNLFKLLNFYLKYFLNNNINIFRDIWMNPFKFDIWAILYNSHLTNDNRNNEK